jgi:hypothetical protein
MLLGPPRHQACHIRDEYGELGSEFKQSETLRRAPLTLAPYRFARTCTMLPSAVQLYVKRLTV